MYVWVFDIILVFEINVQGVSLEMCKERLLCVYIYFHIHLGHNWFSNLTWGSFDLNIY